MSESKATYLGDGAYCLDEGFQFKLYTDQNTVYLDDSALQAFIKYIEKTRSVKITIEES